MKTKEEINEILDKLFDEEDLQKVNERYFGCGYAEGLRDALNWVIEDSDLEGEDLKETLRNVGVAKDISKKKEVKMND